VREGVHRSASDGLPCLDIDHLTPRRVHQDEGVKVGVRFDSNLVGFLFTDPFVFHCVLLEMALHQVLSKAFS
jgi:hypothetical protein